METDLRSRGDVDVYHKMDGDDVQKGQEAPVAKLDLGRGDQPSMLNLLTQKDKEDPRFEGFTWTPEVYEVMFVGPRALTRHVLDRDIRGMIEHPKGLLPRSLFMPRQGDNTSEIFYRQLFVSVRLVSDRQDDSIYYAKFSPSVIWPADWERCRPKFVEVPEATTQSQEDRLPPLRSHARGLGLTMRDLDKMDGLLPESTRSKDMRLWWGSYQFSSPQTTGLVMGPNTLFETDCIEAVLRKITGQLMAAEDGRDAQQKGIVPPEENCDSEPEVPNDGEGLTQQTESEPHKNSFRKRLGKFLRSFLCCCGTRRK